MSVLVEAKNLVEDIIKKLHGESFPIARNEKEENNYLDRKEPLFISLISFNGSFDDRTIAVLKVEDANKKPAQINIRGSRVIPLEVRCFGRTEDEVDNLLQSIEANIPTSWSIGHCKGNINISEETHDDHSSNYADHRMESFIVIFNMQIAPEEIKLPVVSNIKVNT